MISDKRNSFNKITKIFIFANNNHPSVKNNVFSNLFIHKKFDFKRKTNDESALKIAKRVYFNITAIFVLNNFLFDYYVNCVIYYNVYL